MRAEPGRWWMRVGVGRPPPLPGLGAGQCLCPATASKPPSLRWRLGKLTDVCCKYVHCNAGTQPLPLLDRYNQPLPVTMCGPGEREGWAGLSGYGYFLTTLQDRYLAYLTSHASHITRKEPCLRNMDLDLGSGTSDKHSHISISQTIPICQ